MRDFKGVYDSWLASDKLDADSRAELLSIADDIDEIKSRFWAPLEFGTAGLRGLMKAGLGCMNNYTVAQCTQALAESIIDNKEEGGVVITYDTRLNSDSFAKLAASVLAANDIPVYLFDAPRPTPELSFAILHLHCAAGINITASHNPNMYNGYKVFGADGAQLGPEAAAKISAIRAKTDIFTGAKKTAFDAAVRDKKIKLIGYETDEVYLNTLLKYQVSPTVVKECADSLEIVYTPLHGTGHSLVPEILQRIGVKKLHKVPSQMVLDGSFPTTKLPNPEFVEAFTDAIELANKVGSNLIIGTDPDADRMGILVRSESGEITRITGNQAGAILLNYIIEKKKEMGTLAPDSYAIKTIVSTDLADTICKANGVEVINVFTGFKFIGEQINLKLEKNNPNFLLGFEESYGYLSGLHARDKDAVVAAMLIVEAAAYYHMKGKTLYDVLCDIYAKYGFFAERTETVSLNDPDFLAIMAKMMNHARENPPESLGGIKVARIRDYRADTVTELATGKVVPTGLPKSDVLYYEMEDGSGLIIRPSGTEPKVKLYIKVKAACEKEAEAKIPEFKKALVKLLGAE